MILIEEAKGLRSSHISCTTIRIQVVAQIRWPCVVKNDTTAMGFVHAVMATEASKRHGPVLRPRRVPGPAPSVKSNSARNLDILRVHGVVNRYTPNLFVRQTARRTVLCGLCFSSILPAAEPASQLVLDEPDQWPGWLGPKRWPEQLTKVWQVDVGTGYGSSLVVGNDVYQHARQAEDEVVWRLDRTTGRVLWRKSYLVPFKAAGGGEYHGNGPKSCPVYADGRLFSMSINGTLSAWDASSGERLWQRNYDADFGKSHPNWGASTSQIVDGEHVIVHFGTDEAGALI